VYTLVDSDTQTEFYPITDVQPVKKMAPHVCEIMFKLPSAGDESSGSIHYVLQFLCAGLQCTSQQAVAEVDTTGNKSVDQDGNFFVIQ